METLTEMQIKVRKKRKSKGYLPDFMEEIWTDSNFDSMRIKKAGKPAPLSGK